jgi:hypothetical protein
VTPFNRALDEAALDLVHLNSWNLVYQSPSLATGSARVLGAAKLSHPFTVGPNLALKMMKLWKMVPTSLKW